MEANTQNPTHLLFGTPGHDLWCVHVLGPGSVIAQPDYETAIKRAKEWNRQIDEMMSRNPHPYDPIIHCNVSPWPYSAEGHAEALAEHGGNPEDIC